MTEQFRDVPGEVKGESVLVPNVKVLVCPSCEYWTIQGNQMQEYMRGAADAYRKSHEFLTSDEIRVRRERLDYSQQEFAGYLGVGVASIKRWELGQVQDRAMDKLIRVSTDLQEAFNNYKHVEQLIAPHPAGFRIPSRSSSWTNRRSQWADPIFKHADA
jgi:putative zinc finger/helix-turn-helix YgiT family protein